MIGPKNTTMMLVGVLLLVLGSLCVTAEREGKVFECGLRLTNGNFECEYDNSQKWYPLSPRLQQFVNQDEKIYDYLKESKEQESKVEIELSCDESLMVTIR